MEREKKLRARRRILLPFYVLICGLAATALATYLVNENIDFRNRQQVEDARHQLERTIQSRMEAYIGLLRGGAGLFAANESVTLNEFRRFQQRLEVDRRYPGLQGFGYSVSFPRERLEELIDSMRDQGLTNFNIWPAGEREQYHSIVFLEPHSVRNQKAIGYDMFTEPIRRRAMEEARDRGEPRLTRKVELVQELADQDKQPGFLIYLPVYQGGDVPGALEERRSKLQGFIYSPFRAGDLFGSVVSGVNLPGLAFAVWDGTNKTSDDLLFQSNPRFDAGNVAEFSRVDVTGSAWTMGVAPLEKSRPMEGSEMLLAVPLLGVIGSILLCYFTYTEGKARTRSETTANELFNQREWLQTTLRSIGDGVISTNLNGDVEFMNAAAELLTGWKYDQAYGKRLSDIFPINNEETGKPTENPIDKVLATGMMATLPEHTLLIDRRGTLRSIDDSAAPIRDRKGNLVGAILVFREISERRRYERRSTAQHEVTRVLAESPSLSEAATRVLERLCTTLQFEWGVLWLFNEQHGHAEAAYQWHRPETNGAAFEQACREFKPRKGEGLPGMVWAQGQPVWIKNLSNDPRFARAEVARALRFRTAFSFPVQSDSRQFGAIEFFRWEINEPDGELLNVMRGIGAQLGQFMQRKRAEEALAESEALYRSISDTAADGIVVLDEQSRIVMANSAMERIFGSSVNELVGTPIHDVLPKRVRGERDQDIERLMVAGETPNSSAGVEFIGVHRDGTEIPVEISFGIARHGESHLFTGFIRDIRQRKEAERKLRETEERFTLLVRLAEEYAIIIMGPDGKITTWNSGAQRIFGYVDHEVVGKDGSIFFTAEDQAAGTPEQQLRSAESEGQLLDERWQVRKDGSTFWASGSTVCLRAEDGTVRGFAKILRDITERKRMEMSIKEMNQELEIRVQRRTAALQESKEQMEAFSYTVAHDLRAPLRAMQGFAYSLMDEYQNMLDLVGSDYLRRIMSSAERMDALIQDLLQYSRLSGSELSFSPVAVHEAVQSALQQCEQEIERAGAEVQVLVKPLFVMAHAATLENALVNLVANALKFRRPGVPPKITIRAITRDEFVQVSVQDNGIGIAREHHGRIFRVFERLHGVNKFPGTGIGLAMVKKGVERMGGRVGVSSDPGEGSLFWIELPRATEEFATEENDGTMASENGSR